MERLIPVEYLPSVVLTIFLLLPNWPGNFCTINLSTTTSARLFPRKQHAKRKMAAWNDESFLTFFFPNRLYVIAVVFHSRRHCKIDFFQHKCSIPGKKILGFGRRYYDIVLFLLFRFVYFSPLARENTCIRIKWCCSILDVFLGEMKYSFIRPNKWTENSIQIVLAFLFFLVGISFNRNNWRTPSIQTKI